MPRKEHYFKIEYLGKHILTRDQFYDFTERLRELMDEEIGSDFGGVECWDYEEEKK